MEFSYICYIYGSFTYVPNDFQILDIAPGAMSSPEPLDQVDPSMGCSWGDKA
jgi:hypothetical protein